MFEIPVRITQMPPGMSEFPKTLIAVATGVIIGLVVQSLNGMFMDWISRRRIIRSLAEEINSNAWGVRIYEVNDSVSPLELLKSERFEHYYAIKREVMFEVKGFEEIRNFYELVAEKKRKAKTGQYTAEDTAEVRRGLMDLDVLFKTNDLPKQLQKVLHKPRCSFDRLIRENPSHEN
jgi:hypothetical protein